MCSCAMVHEEVRGPLLPLSSFLPPSIPGSKLRCQACWVTSPVCLFFLIGSYISHEVTSQNCYKKKQANTYKATSTAPAQG